MAVCGLEPDGSSVKCFNISIKLLLWPGRCSLVGFCVMGIKEEVGFGDFGLGLVILVILGCG